MNKAPTTKLVLLSTSDIFTTTEPRIQRLRRRLDNIPEPTYAYGARFTSVHETGQQQRHIWTRGILEMALEEGFNVWVVSTRENPGPHDQWWRELIPNQFVIFHGADLAKKWKSRILDHFRNRLSEDSLIELGNRLDGPNYDCGNTLTSLPYMVWALLNDFEWPFYEKTDEPVFWTSVLGYFEQEGLILTSRYFRGRLEAEEDEIAKALKARPGRIKNNTCLDCGCAAGECEC